jgi:hypothetical protein
MGASRHRSKARPLFDYVTDTLLPPSRVEVEAYVGVLEAVAASAGGGGAHAGGGATAAERAADFAFAADVLARAERSGVDARASRPLAGALSFLCVRWGALGCAAAALRSGEAAAAAGAAAPHGAPPTQPPPPHVREAYVRVLREALIRAAEKRLPVHWPPGAPRCRAAPPPLRALLREWEPLFAQRDGPAAELRDSAHLTCLEEALELLFDAGCVFFCFFFARNRDNELLLQGRGGRNPMADTWTRAPPRLSPRRPSRH